MVFGYEFVGIVVEVGFGVIDFKKGDCVVFEFGYFCCCCFDCFGGSYNFCYEMVFVVIFFYDGMLIGFWFVFYDFCYKLFDNVFF